MGNVINSVSKGGKSNPSPTYFPVAKIPVGSQTWVLSFVLLLL